MAKSSSREKQFFYNQLKGLLNAQVSLDRALDSIAKHRSGSQLAETYQAMHACVKQGRPLSEFMSGHKDAFTAYETNLIEVGESSDRLPEVLDWLAQMYGQEQELESASLLQKWYLRFVIGMGLAVLVLFSYWVTPMFRELGLGMNMGWELPRLTQYVFAFTEWTIRYWPPVLITLIVLRLTLPRVWSRYHQETSLLISYFPWAGPRWMMLESLRFARRLGHALEVGMDLGKALESSAEFIEHPYLKESLLKMGPALAEGGSFARALKNVRVFPGYVIAFARLGENQGELGKALLEAASTVGPRSKFMPVEMVQFLVMVLVLIILAIYILALYLPMFSMAGSFN